MIARRVAAIVLAVAAGLALLPAALMALLSPMIFDAPKAGGWPTYLFFAAKLVPAPALLAALIVAVRCAVRPTREQLALAASLVAAPALLFAVAWTALDVVCDGQFTCAGA